MPSLTDKPLARAAEHLAAGRYSQAIGAYRVVLGIDPALYPAHIGVADAEARRGDLGAAVDALLAAASQYAALQDHVAALVLYGHSLQLDPSRIDVHLDVAVSESAAGHHDAAVQRCHALAQMYAQAQRAEEAEEILRFAASWAPGEVSAYAAPLKVTLQASGPITLADDPTAAQPQDANPVGTDGSMPPAVSGGTLPPTTGAATPSPGPGEPVQPPSEATGEPVPAATTADAATDSEPVQPPTTADAPADPWSEWADDPRAVAGHTVVMRVPEGMFDAPPADAHEYNPDRTVIAPAPPLAKPVVAGVPSSGGTQPPTAPPTITGPDPQTSTVIAPAPGPDPQTSTVIAPAPGPDPQTSTVIAPAPSPKQTRAAPTDNDKAIPSRGPASPPLRAPIARSGRHKPTSAGGNSPRGDVARGRPGPRGPHSRARPLSLGTTPAKRSNLVDRLRKQAGLGTTATSATQQTASPSSATDAAQAVQLHDTDPADAAVRRAAAISDIVYDEIDEASDEIETSTGPTGPAPTRERPR